VFFLLENIEEDCTPDENDEQPCISNECFPKRNQITITNITNKTES